MRLASLLSPIVLLSIWEIGARAGFIDARFFPAPTTIFVVFLEMVRSGELWTHLQVSLQRIVIGFILGAVPGIFLGLAIGLLPFVRAVLQPLVDATFPIPKVAIFPLLILTLGLGEASKYAIIAIAVVYLVLINTVAGVRNIDRIYFDVGRNYRATSLMTFTDIAFPGALPTILAGLRLGLGVALLIIVAAEYVGAKSGIGYLIWTSWQVFQVEQMYVGIMVTAVLGFGSALLLNEVERRVIPWKRR